MKVRLDFVSNSSSTSFLLIAKEGFTREAFLRLMGVEERSPLMPVFEALFDRLLTAMVPASQYREWRYADAEDLGDLVRDKFSDEVARRVIDAQQQGKKIFVGELSSESESIESFFCCESFEREDEDLYFNALECSW